jgi:hypothetical protein
MATAMKLAGGEANEKEDERQAISKSAEAFRNRFAKLTVQWLAENVVVACDVLIFRTVSPSK